MKSTRELLILSALLILAGCASKPVPRSSIARITPPVPKVRPEKPPAPLPRTEFTFRWDDCVPQPTGVWYRVYERFTASRGAWEFYRAVTNVHSLTIPTTNALAFYTVTVTDGTNELWAVDKCQ